uniref:Eukaryotic translation initiation factor 4 gamma, 1a n=1 Tax=Oncorhynchus mykiss TaxID=8022 RepID=A0A8C7VBN8_ONCMY
MNKPPQPITGPTSVPHPSPSPGLTQAAYAPGQPPSLVFATPPPQQMNSSPQPRQFAAGPRALHQQPYYANRATMSTSAPRVQTSSGPRPVGPTHVYQPSSQMMMIPGQQLSFAGSPQGYFIPPGQYRAPYMPPSPQYPVTSGTAGFYPGTSPAEYPTYAGAYYPAQPQYSHTPPVQTAPVMLSPAQPQQQALPPQPPPSQPLAPKRERIAIRIRDPNQGGRDITEEIMSGGRATSTPPSQVCLATHWGLPVQDNVTSQTIQKQTMAAMTPPPALVTPEPATATVSTEAKQEKDSQAAPPTEQVVSQSAVPTAVGKAEEAIPPEEDQAPPPSPSPPAAPTSVPPAEVQTPPPITTIAQVSDTVDAGVTLAGKAVTPEAPPIEEEPSAALAAVEKPPALVAEKEEAENKKEEVVVEEEEIVEKVKEEPVLTTKPEVVAPVTVAETAAAVPVSAPVPAVTPSKREAQTPLSNGLPQEYPDEVDAPVPAQERTAMPNTEPAVPTPQETATLADAAVAEEGEKGEDAATVPLASSPSEDTSMQGERGRFLLVGITWLGSTVGTKGLAGADGFSSRKSPSPVQTLPLLHPFLPTEQWKPIDPEDKKRYDREFLLGFRYIGASMNKPEGLPLICDVVLDKANKTPMRPAEPGRNMMNAGPDFTPAFMGNLGRQSSGGGGGGPRGPGRDHMGIIISSSLGGDVELNKAEKAWKPAVKMAGSRGTGPEEEESDDPEQAKTQELFKRVRSILNKLTPQMFQQLMKQVTELTIDTEERLKGVIDLIFEKAISEPNFSVAYANMCRCLMGLKVPTTDKPGVTVNFRKLLLNRCQKEFEKDQDDDVIFEAKQKEMEAAKEEEKAGLKAELEEAKDKARRRSLGNIKFIGELFKLKMLTEAIMHDCIVKLLKNHDEESLECLCRLLSTIGKDLDFEKAKPRMDQYFAQMDKIIKEKKTSSRIRFMLQDVIDLRRSGWVPRRGEQGPKTIDQIHKDAEREEQMQLVKVQQQLMSRNDSGGGRDQGGRGGQHGGQGARGSQPQDEGWNTVPISTKNRPIDTSRLSKITKPGALDFNNQLLAPQLGGKGMWGSWGKGSSGGTTGAKPTGRPATGNRFSALQQSAPPALSSDADRRVPQSMSDDRNRGSRDRGGSGSRDRAPSKEAVGKRLYTHTLTHTRFYCQHIHHSHTRWIHRETGPTLPPAAPAKPAMTEEELDKKSSAIIEEYLHLNDMKEALQCVGELNSAPLLFVFVRNGLEDTLERSAIARERMGLLLHQLLKAGTLPTTQYYKGLQEILEVAEDMAIDIPHIWQYLAELITPMLHDGGIPMGQLFREISKPLVPLGKAGLLLVQILHLLCKGMTHKKVGGLWTEAGLNWRDFLPEDEDVNKFVTEQKIEFTLGEESGETNQKKPMSGEELSKHLDRLIQDRANNQRIRDWVEANLDEQQAAANQFVRALMTSICQSAVICENPYKVDVEQITQRAKLLQRYLSDEHRELQALYALQALMVHMEQPANLLRMFFDALYDEDVIKEEAFYRWESSKDPAEQTGKGVALKSVTAFFTWLREAEEESDKD